MTMWQDLSKLATAVGDLKKQVFDQSGQNGKSKQVTPVRLKDAIRELHNCSLALDLRGRVLTRLCDQMELDLDHDNSEICELLALYYTEPGIGALRAIKDNCFVCDYVIFDLKSVINRLNALAKKPNFLTLVSAKGHPADGQYFDLVLRSTQGDYVCRTASSVVGIVDIFSEQLEAIGSRVRFCSIDSDSVFIAYAMEIAQQKYLAQGKILQFDEMYE